MLCSRSCKKYHRLSDGGRKPELYLNAMKDEKQKKKKKTKSKAKKEKAKEEEVEEEKPVEKIGVDRVEGTACEAEDRQQN